MLLQEINISNYKNKKGDVVLNQLNKIAIITVLELLLAPQFIDQLWEDRVSRQVLRVDSQILRKDRRVLKVDRHGLGNHEMFNLGL